MHGRNETQRLIGLVLLGGAACASSPQADASPEIVWEGQWLRYGRSDSLGPECVGSAHYMDRYVGALAEVFGVPSDFSVSFYYVDESSNPCDSLACTRGNRIFSQESVQEHELVHAVRSFRGFSHFVLEEGAAEYWGDDSLKYPFRSDVVGDLVDTVANASRDGLPTSDYGVAGRFHALLDEDVGDEALNELLLATSRETSGEQLSMQLDIVTGLDLGAWNESLDAYGACDHAVFRNPIAACDSVRTVQWCVSGESVPIEEWVGCSDEETLGPRDGEIWKYVSIDIEIEDTYVLFIEPQPVADGSVVRLKECRGGCTTVREEFSVPTQFAPGQTFSAVPGRYLVKLAIPEFEERAFRLIMTGGGCT